jgi:hypothetical protein
VFWGRAMRWLMFMASGVLLSGCAGQFLNESTLSMSPSIGTVEERQVLENLAKFAANPWAIPGHVELSNGQIQITNQLGVNLKFPYSKVLNGSGAVTSKTLGAEADVNPAQTQDQESYNLLPVTDSEDLRRLRALYHYAVCPGDKAAFAFEWALADQQFFRASVSAKGSAKPAAPRQTVSEVVRKDLQDAIKSNATPEKTANLIAGRIARNVSPADLGKIQNEKTDTIVAVVGSDAPLVKPYAAPSPSKQGQKSDATKDNSGADTVAFEEYKKEVILSKEGLGTEPWLFLRRGDGTFSSACPEVGYLSPLSSPTVYLGTVRGYEFWTTDRKKFSDLVLFVLGGIPNTVGSHIIGGVGSKAGATSFFNINGQSGVIAAPKATAR